MQPPSPLAHEVGGPTLISTENGDDEESTVSFPPRDPSYLQMDDSAVLGRRSTEPSQSVVASMVGIESMEPPSHQEEGEEGSPADVVKSGGCSSDLSDLGEDGESGGPTNGLETLLSLENRRAEGGNDLSDLGEDDESGGPMNGLETLLSLDNRRVDGGGDLSDLGEDDESGGPMDGLETLLSLDNRRADGGGDLSDLGEDDESGGPMDGLETLLSLDNRKVEEENDSDDETMGGPLSDSEKEEARPANAKSLESSDYADAAVPIVAQSEATPKTALKLNQISSDFESAIRLAAQLELRRSSRNIPKKKTPTNDVDYAPPRKSSSSKKKPTFRIDGNLLQVGVGAFPTHKVRQAQWHSFF